MNLVSPGLFQSDNGGFYVRPWIRGRRTWRKLRAVKLRAAILEAARTDFSAPAGAFADLAREYVKHHCPNRQLEPREATFTHDETKRAYHLIQFFGNLPASSIRLADLPRYHAWRKRRARFGGDRAVDKDLCTLSNILNYGVSIGSLEINYIARNRPRYRREKDVRHSRVVAPASADVIHALADYFLSAVRSEVFAWQGFFAQFTGRRTSELLRLRLDAENEDQPGFIADSYLFFGKLSKEGIDPWSEIGPEFATMICAFRAWHEKRFPNTPYFFPSPFGKCPVNPGAFGHALTRATVQLKLAHITPHGFRSFYVTKRRSDGAKDTQIAGEIGDRTVALMHTTYGARPSNWRGGSAMTWLPQDRLPAWQGWLPTEKLQPVDYGLDYGKNRRKKQVPQVVGKVVAGDGIEPPTQGFSGTSSLVPKSPFSTLTNVCRPIGPANIPQTPESSEPSGL